MGYVNPTDRVAAACIAAVKPWRSKHDIDIAKLKALADPVARLTDLVACLLKQIAQQGLAPTDFDCENGPAALVAIADAIFSGKKKIAFFATLPVEWKHVYSAAARILDRER